MRGDRLLAVDSETEREETWELGDMGALRGAGWGDPFYWETSEHVCIRALMFPNKTLFLTMEAGTVPSSLRLFLLRNGKSALSEAQAGHLEAPAASASPHPTFNSL